MFDDPSFTTPEGVNALLNQNQKGRFARQIETRAALRQRLDLQDLFAELRGQVGMTFRNETFYGPSSLEEASGR